MSSMIACPGCKARLQTRPEHAGKKIRCPKCSGIVRVPELEAELVEEVEEVEEIEEVEEERGITEERRPRRRERREEPEERPSRLRDRDLDVRKKKSKYARCPECRSRGATRVGWTLWGGMIGPMLFTHVQCPECGTTYNGNTGKSNLVPITLYVTLSVLAGLGLVVAGFLATRGK